MDGTSQTPQEEKLKALQALLPEAFAEGKIDWEKLKATLGENVNFANERYVLNWAGKSDAFKVLQTPTTKTLIPAKDESINFDATQNIFIEGENLEVLKVLQKSYFGKVKMIYIDPPYNTGNDSFIYPDKFGETVAEYERRVGDKDEEGYMTKSTQKFPSVAGVSPRPVGHPSVAGVPEGRGGKFSSVGGVPEGRSGKFSSVAGVPEGRGGKFPSLGGVSEGRGGKFPSLGGVSDRTGWSKNTKENGQYHSNWLNMMMPRLYLAKNLLKQDGVIFVSIDDNEVHNLRLLMNEIFGEENFLGCLPTVMNLKGNNDQFGFSGTHEYSLVFLKDYNSGRIGEFTLNEDEIEKWDEDEFGLYKQGANLKSTGANAPREKRPNLFFPIYIQGNEFSLEKKEGFEEIYPITNNQHMSWRWSRSKFSNEQHNLIISKTGNEYSIYKKQRPDLGELPSKKPKSFFYKPNYSSGNGTKELKDIFNERFFSNPKPLSLIRDFIQIGSNPDDLILDFFAGSGTTAHAVMELNAQDGGSRRYICVQLPEPCHEGSEAHKAGYATIAEISKERIRRASKKIETELQQELAKQKTTLEFPASGGVPAGRGGKFPSYGGVPAGRGGIDLGFKVMRLADSNFKQWQQVAAGDVEALAEQIKLFIDPIAENATNENMVYEFLLKSGKDLNSTITKHQTFFAINGNELVLLLEEVSGATIEKVIAQRPIKVIALDRLFVGNDQLKTNTVLQMRDAGIEFKTI